MKFRFLVFFLFSLLPNFAHSAPTPNLLASHEHPAVSGLRVANHYDFPVRESIAFRLTPELAAQGGNLLAVSHSVVGGTVEAHYLPVQIVPDENGKNSLAWIDVQLRPRESRRYTFQNLGSGGKSEAKPEISHRPNGLPHRVSFPSGISVELFDLSLVEIFEKPENLSPATDERLRDALSLAVPGKFELVAENHGPVLSSLLYRGEFHGENSFRAEIRYQIPSSGIADVLVDLQPIALKRKTGYLALAKTFASENETASVRHHGNVEKLPSAAGSESTASAAEIRWLALHNESSETARALLADFAPNLTRLHDGRYVPVNGDFINERAIAHENGWSILSEIARANPANPSTATSFILPEESETISLRFRILPAREQAPETIDQAFTAFAGYRGRSVLESDLQIDFGVGAAGFGAVYSAKSADRERIARDFRIANAIGLDWIRLSGIDPAKDAESLQSFAQIAEETGLKLLVPLSADPTAAVRVAENSGPAIAFYELAADISSSGVSVHQLAQAEKTRDAILEARPESAIILQSPPHSLSLQKRIADSGFSAPTIAQVFPANLAADSGRTRDAVLALGGFSSSRGKSPLISEFNWTSDTSQNENEQANAFFLAHQNLLEQRAAGAIFVSGFPEHALHPDGTPTAQGQALYELVRRHSSDAHRNKRVEIKMPLLRISADRTIAFPVTITNKGNEPIEIRSRPLLPDGLTTDSAEENFTLRPRQSRTIQRSISAGSDLAPGMYHIFEEVRVNDNVRLGWTYAKSH